MENPAPAVFLCGAPEDYANYRAALTAAGLRPVVSRSLTAALGCEALLLPGGGQAVDGPQQGVDLFLEVLDLIFQGAVLLQGALGGLHPGEGVLQIRD